MSNNKISTDVFLETKPHYQILDGLRGVAALMVIWYHVFEAFATSPFDQRFNHGYLAVDFFFILSGFVVGYAYDDRWKKMSVRDFFKRRLIRLHPMIVLGTVLGVVSFVVQGSEQWNGDKVALSSIMLAMLLHLFLIPALPGSPVEVRGHAEMYPLNGPTWSLFFEYLGNILYALFIRRLGTKVLGVLVLLSGLGLASFALFNLSGFGNLGVGWSLAGNNFLGGSLRLMYAFSVGLFLSRVFKPVRIKGAFWICSILLVVLLSIPYVGSSETLWMNGLYDSVCTILVFPLLVYLGASGKTTHAFSSQVCKFLGDISYPLYIVHYPSMYLFYSWVWKNKLSFEQTWYVAVLLFVGNILLAYLCLKLYDSPVRKYLTRNFFKK